MEVYEPMVSATILAPGESLGSIIEEVIRRRGLQTDLKYLEDGRIVLQAQMPWAEVVIDFHDTIKNITSGYATFNYVESPPRVADLLKVPAASVFSGIAADDDAGSRSTCTSTTSAWTPCPSSASWTTRSAEDAPWRRSSRR
jgi:translation elongation factor EF-4